MLVKVDKICKKAPAVTLYLHSINLNSSYEVIFNLPPFYKVFIVLYQKIALK